MTQIDVQVIDGLLKLPEGRSPAYQKRHGFNQNSARIWVRAGFRCEYCDQSLLEHVTAYYSFQYDHILPQSKYVLNPFIRMSTSDLFGSRALTDELLNVFALSCRLCNSIKSNYDPNADGKIYSGDGPLDDEARLVLIGRVRSHLSELRQEYKEAFENVRSYVNDEHAGAKQA